MARKSKNEAKEVEKELSAEEITDEHTVKTLGEDVTTDWETYVRSEVEAMLEAILPVSTAGAVGVVYKNLITEELEGGPVFDETKAVGVDIVLSFDFGGEIVKPM